MSCTVGLAEQPSRARRCRCFRILQVHTRRICSSLALGSIGSCCDERSTPGSVRPPISDRSTQVLAHPPLSRLSPRLPPGGESISPARPRPRGARRTNGGRASPGSRASNLLRLARTFVRRPRSPRLGCMCELDDSLPRIVRNSSGVSIDSSGTRRCAGLAMCNGRTVTVGHRNGPRRARIRACHVT